ncbi:uncharacterized protein LOC124140995 isoform X1 [Haliotis rufescens]|uniref:uncharacterized protein LOC124140995 isoform X1 n=2 Tax=Haliotis rufescens TaxID=6454 RepID=UPI00201F33EC|nr:uncharacterized protein LOC124140995 isoform X1 [Haliotis rufescens]
MGVSKSFWSACLVVSVFLPRGYCTMSVKESLTSFMGGTILSYFVDVSKCHQYLDPSVNVTSFYGRETDAYIIYFNQTSWHFYLSTENYIDGKQFNLSTPVIRLLGTYITPSGNVTVNVIDLGPDGSQLSSGFMECPGNEEKPGIELLAGQRNKTSLATVASIKTALHTGVELSYSANFSDCMLSRLSEPVAVLIIGGVIKEIEEDGRGGYTFSQMTLPEGSALLVKILIQETGTVVGIISGISHHWICTLGKTFKIYAH